MNKKITIFGLGYVGCSMATLLSQNNKVIAIDIDLQKVTDLNNRKSPIKDLMIDDFLKNKELDLLAVSSLNPDDDSDYYIIATPTDYDEELNYFNTSSVQKIIKIIKKVNKISPIIIKSTIPIGFIDQVNKEYSCKNIIFSPEFLREGSALYDNLNPSRIIIGNKSALAKGFANLLLEASHKKVVPTFFTGSKEAECIKLFANSYLAMRVSFFNELDTYGYKNNLDVRSIVEGVSSDERIGEIYNNPSFGYGGYCLPKDTKQLLANYKDIPQKIISSIVESNEVRKKFIAEEIIKRNIKTVGIYLLAMKADSDNYRSSAIIGIITKLRAANIKIFIYEPNINQKYFMEDIEVLKQLEVFKEVSDLILANRKDHFLNDVENKLFTRDLFGNN
jgi:UDPglucose 6-dehydrogenase